MPSTRLRPAASPTVRYGLAIVTLLLALPAAGAAQTSALAFVPGATPPISVIDVATRMLETIIPIGFEAQSATASPDGRWIYVPDGIGRAITVIDVASRLVVASIPVPAMPFAVVFSPDGAVAYVSCDASAQIAVIDLKEKKVSALIDVGKTADGMAWAPAK